MARPLDQEPPAGPVRRRPLPMGWAYGRQVDPERPHESLYKLTPEQMHGSAELNAS